MTDGAIFTTSGKYSGISGVLRGVQVDSNTFVALKRDQTCSGGSCVFRCIQMF